MTDHIRNGKFSGYRSDNHSDSLQINMFEYLEECYPSRIPFSGSTAADSPINNDIHPNRAGGDTVLGDINPFLALVSPAYRDTIGSLFYHQARIGTLTSQAVVAGVRRTIQESLCQTGHQVAYRTALADALEGLDLETAGALDFAASALEDKTESAGQRNRRKAAPTEPHGDGYQKEGGDGR